MDEEAEGERDSGRELGLALLKFVMESSVLGRRDGELGILPVSLPFAALIESSPFSPPSLPLRTRQIQTDRQRRGKERERERGGADFLRYYHTRGRRDGEGRERRVKKRGTPRFNEKHVMLIKGGTVDEL